MNHQRRVKNALQRVLAPHYHKSDLFDLLADEFVRQLQSAERDGHRAAIASAANAVGKHLGHQHPAFEDVLALLEKPR